MIKKTYQFSNGVKIIILKFITFYQKFISPLGNHCRFYPSCSEYARLSIEKYGILAGCWKGIRRILRCHRFSRGGVDQP